jgi:hypothetical protein
MIWGRLSGPNVANQVVVLWHGVNPDRRFTPVQSVRTNARGFYEIERADGVVISNRNWYVVSDGARSRTVHEKVFAEVSLHSSTQTAHTNEPVVFSGHVQPNHAGGRILLQRQIGRRGDDWRTIAAGRIGPGSNFSIVHRFREPGNATLRARLPGDQRNLRSDSAPVSLVILRRQNPRLTLNASANPINAGQSVTLSGTLVGPNNANQPVTLFAHTDRQSYAPVAQASTDSRGNYRFIQSPINNTVYKVRAAGRESTQLFEGVSDVVTISTSANRARVGQTITISGGVVPDKTGHVVYLQLRGDDGEFHTIQTGRVQVGSSYRFAHRLQSAGQKVYRVVVPGGPENLRGVSPTVTVDVAPVPPEELPDESRSG